MIAWGLVGWGLGNLIFDCGYSHYHNPYPVQPIVVSSGPPVTYSQPITVVAAATAPAAEAAVSRSEAAINESLASFKRGDYLSALESVNKAISASPGDGAFHEYRALVLFALGQYGEAAGVLHPLLASSPGWDWSTMIQLYGNADEYTGQLRKLEDYANVNEDSASSQFLLGYHYMVCTYLEQAAAAFTKASELMPADQVSVQMAKLAASSTTSGETEGVDADGEGAPETPEPVELEQILGSWESDNGDNGVVTLALSDAGTFTWTYKGKEGKPFDMTGTFNLGQGNILTLDAGDSQMAGTAAIDSDGKLSFVLAGGPPGDPGLLFDKG